MGLKININLNLKSELGISDRSKRKLESIYKVFTNIDHLDLVDPEFESYVEMISLLFVG